MPADGKGWSPPPVDGPAPRAWEARIRGIARALHAVSGQALDRAATERRATEHDREESHGRASAAATTARCEAEATAATEFTAALSRVRQEVEALAPGLASADLTAPGWTTTEFVGTGIPAYVRVGTYTPPEQEPVPVVYPLFADRGWQIWADGRSFARHLLQGVLLRTVASADPTRLRIDGYDPRLSGTLGLLGRLTEQAPGVVAPTLHSATELGTLLADLVETSSRRGARLTQLGHRDFTAWLATSPHAVEPYRLVVLLDYPAGIDAQANAELARIAESARERGIVLLVHYDQDALVERDVDPRQLLDLLRPVVLGGHGVRTAELNNVPVKPDAPPDAAFSAAVCDTVAGIAGRAQLPAIQLSDTLPSREHWWKPVRDELATTIGYAGNRPVRLRLRSGNPPLPNILVGGAVGQGKSNLLLGLIHGLAVRYPPEDLEMYLLDFKQSLEFSALGPRPGREYWLPHARVLGIYSDRAFGLAVLRHLSGELERRSELLKAMGATDIAQLPPGDARPPRALLILDEFQVLLADDDDVAGESARLLERLVRLGRAYGVHVVLATQSLEGIQRLATRRESILGQVPYRIALKTTRTESQNLLQLHNMAAADLRFRGEAIMNDDYGAARANTRVLVPFADPDALDALRRELWGKAGPPADPPRTFQLGEAAELTGVRAAPMVGVDDEDTLPVWVGMPISVTETPVTMAVRPEPGSGLAVLGDGPSEALGVLSGVVVSAASGTDESGRVVLLDGLSSNPPAAGAKAALVDVLQALGCSVELVERDGVADRLFELRDAIGAGSVGTGPTHIVGYGLHRVPAMSTQPEGRLETPAEALRAILADGPTAGVFTYAWWNRLHVCTDHLGWDRTNVGAYLFLRHPQDGVRQVCGPLVHWEYEPGKALFYNGLHDEPVPVVPFAAPSPGEAARLAGQLAHRRQR